MHRFHRFRSFGAAPLGICAAMLVFGLALLIKPQMTTDLIFNILGVGLIVVGAGMAVWYFLSKYNDPRSDSRLAYGVIMACVGLSAVIFKKLLVSFIPFIFGAVLFISGVVKLQAAMNMRRMLYPKWWSSMIGAGISVVLGLLITLNPFGSAMTLMRVNGIAFIVEAVQNLMTTEQYKHAVHDHFEHGHM